MKYVQVQEIYIFEQVNIFNDTILVGIINSRNVIDKINYFFQ